MIMPTNKHHEPTGVPPSSRSSIDTALAQESVCAAFQITAQANGDAPALRAHGTSTSISWRLYAQRVQAIAEGLWSLGVRPGSTVACVMANRPEFHLVDMALLHLGAISTALVTPITADKVAWYLEHADADVLVGEAQTLLPLAAAHDLSRMVRHVVTVEPRSDDSSFVALDELEQLVDPTFDFEATWRAVGPRTLANITYTSGTTGEPKGATLTHGNVVWAHRAVDHAMSVKPHGRVIAYLPMGHIYERFMSHYGSAFFGFAITDLADVDALPEALKETEPTLFWGVPRTYEKLATSAEALVDALALRPALETAIAGVSSEQAGRSVSAVDRAALSDARIALAPIARELGFASVDYAVISGAPSVNDLFALYHALGVPLGNLWGMSEAMVDALSTPGDVRFGTAGEPAPHVEVRVADDGELVVRGPHVFAGYHKDRERTREVLDEDGWFHTGDVGTIDQDGLVRITGRKKDLLITSGGKKVAPAAIERAVAEQSPLIDYVAAVADGRKYVTALLALDDVELRRFAAASGLGSRPFAELVTQPVVGQEISRAVAAGNATLGHVERVKAYRVVDHPWAPGGDEVTSILKLRRGNILRKYADLVEEMYS